MKTTLFLTLLILSTSACSTGFNRSNLQRELTVSSLALKEGYQVKVDPKKEQVDAEDIKAALALKPQVTFPFKLAVRFIKPKSRNPNFERWTDDDRRQVEEWEMSLLKQGIASQVFLISDLTTSDDTLPQLRLAAAKHGADALLVIQSASAVDSYVNPSALLYLSIIGLYFVPGTHADALVMLQGAMYDVGNEYLYLSVDAEAEEKTWGAAAFVSRDKAVEKAKTKALKRFGDEFLRRSAVLK